MLTWVFRALCLLSISALTLAVYRKNGITIENNGFKNVLIAIHDDVPENRELLLSIQKSFTAASRFLYHATKQRAYFRDIRILVPVTWSDNVTYSSPDAEYFSNADITIVTGDEFHDDSPSVKTYRGCGQPGEYMEMTDRYLVDPNVTKKFGPQDKVLVHEWAHLRWGVFDEYPSDADSEFYYSVYSERWEPTRCARALTGTIIKYTENGFENCTGPNPESGRYDNGCAFYPNLQQKSKEIAMASIMDRQYVKSIKFFCENTTDISAGHNEEAPNKHNRLCGARSTWDVITSTADFANGNNPPRNVLPSEQVPRFTFVRHKQTSPKVVLVLDESGSMSGDGKMLRVVQAVTKFIRFLRDGTRIGVVMFSTDARILFNLTTVNFTEEREQLIAKLPLDQKGSSNIGAGLSLAANMLRNESGSIVLLAGGKDEGSPTISEVLPRILKTNSIIHSIAFTKSADPHMSLVSTNTGGTFYYDKNAPESHDLEGAMTSIANNIGKTMVNSHDSQPTEIFATTKYLRSGERITKTAYLNDGLGKRTRFEMLYSKSQPTFTATAPSGYVYNNTSEEVKVELKTGVTNLVIPGIAEAGEWTFSVENVGPDGQSIRLWFYSYPTSPSTSATVVKAFVYGTSKGWPSVWTIVADAQCGGRAILGLTVMATVARPNASDFHIQLLDNGIGADLTKDDGVYSRYFTQFTVPGRYSVSVDAQAKPGVGKLLVVKHWQKATPLIDPENLPAKDSAVTRDQKKKQKQLPVAVPGGISMATTAGSLEMNLPKDKKDFNFSRDIYPPAKITDLRVVATDVDTPSVTLVWTAPGDDLDVGTAASYSIFSMKKANGNSRVRVNNSDIILGNITNPKSSGNVERFVVRVPYDKALGNVSFLFTVTATDDSGLSSPPSNEVAAGFGAVPPIIEQTGNMTTIRPTAAADDTTETTKTLNLRTTEETRQSTSTLKTTGNQTMTSMSTRVEYETSTMISMLEKYRIAIIGVTVGGAVLLVLGLSIMTMFCLNRAKSKTTSVNQSSIDVELRAEEA